MKLRRAPRAIAAILAIAWVWLAVPAAAAPAASGDVEARRQAAQAALTEGNQLFGRESYEGALAAYQRAFQQFPSPKLHFNIGQAHRALGHPVEATESYETFLAECADASAELRAEAEGYLKELRREVGRIALVSDVADAEVRVDDQPRGRTPLPRPLLARAGERRVSVEKAGFARHDERITVVAGEEATLTVRLGSAVPAPGVAALAAGPAVVVTTAPAPTAPPRPIYKRWWFWTGIAAVTAVAVAGTVHAMSSSGLECPSMVHCLTAQ